jgi:phage baseplate assembly protein W
MSRRSEYFYNPIDLDKDVAVGIKLPFGKESGLFKLSYTTEDQAVSNLKNLLLTKKGERPFQPEFGSSIYGLLFEQLTSDIAQRLEESIIGDIEFWLPYIVINDLSVNVNEDANSVKIQLSFRVTEQGTNQQIIIFVDSNGFVNIE